MKVSILIPCYNEEKSIRKCIESCINQTRKVNEIVVVDELKLKEPKTKLMAQALGKLAGDGSALIVIPEKNDANEVITLSARNLPNAKTLMVSYLNIRDLLSYDKLILPVQALDAIADHLG